MVKPGTVLLLCLCTASPAPALQLRVKPGGAVLQDLDGGQVLATASPGRVGTVEFATPSGRRHLRLSRPFFDSLDMSVWNDEAGQWHFESPHQRGILDTQTLLVMSCHVRLNVRPEDTRVYCDAEVANGASDPEHSMEVAPGLRRHVVPLEQSDGLVRIPDGWTPPTLYLVHPRFETQVLQIPEGGLDGVEGPYPPAPIQLRPAYGPFSYPSFDIAVGILLPGGWMLWRSRQRVQQQRNALLDHILGARQGLAPAPERQSQQVLTTDTGRRYMILQILGQGGMGTVYEALPVEPAEGPHVAIKVLRYEAWSDAEAHQRFSREARICASLQHPAIVKVLDWGMSEAGEPGAFAPFMVMELVGGCTLRSLLTGQPLASDQVVAWLVDILKGLRAAHASGVVHRDIKPENLMVTPGNHIKIMDFGIARLQGAQTLTGTNTNLGTPAYMSLEHLKANTMSPASDIYSLGVVAFEMLAGRRPFEELEIWAMIGHLLSGRVTSLLDANPAVPGPLAAVVMRMMAPQVEDRYADADSVLGALRLAES